MSRARLVITAVVLEGRSQAEVARSYGLSRSWVSRLVARYRAEGESDEGTPRSRCVQPQPLPTEPGRRRAQAIGRVIGTTGSAETASTRWAR